jgi:hypothetical protein
VVEYILLLVIAIALGAAIIWWIVNVLVPAGEGVGAVEIGGIVVLVLALIAVAIVFGRPLQRV